MKTNKIYVKSKDGSYCEIGEILEIGVEEPAGENTGFETKDSFEITFEKAHLTAELGLALIGWPTSNNWRKMHGGIMTRKVRGKRC